MTASRQAEKERTLNWLLATLRSSVGKKFVMGGTGLFLCFFLVMHLAGNLLLFAGSHAYNTYAETLHQNVGLLVIAEIVLFTAMLLHIYLAYATAVENRTARGAEPYAVKQTKIPGRVVNFLGMSPDTTMFITGALIFGYLCIHLSDFKFEIFADETARAAAPYDKAARVLGLASRKIIYFLAACVVGIHVSHGFSSAFQSLGLRHPKYTPTIQCIGKVFAIMVTLGFASLVFWDSERNRTTDRQAPRPPLSIQFESAQPLTPVDAMTAPADGGSP